MNVITRRRKPSERYAKPYARMSTGMRALSRERLFSFSICSDAEEG